MKTISFKTTKKDHKLIGQIVDRAMRLSRQYAVEYPQRDCMMDITACHSNGCKLDLEKLLLADDFNFAHDVIGIRAHLDRETGKLTDCFVPRCSV